MKRIFIQAFIPAVVLLPLILFITASAQRAEAFSTKPTPYALQNDTVSLEKAFRTALTQKRLSKAGIALFEIDIQQVEISTDNRWGSAWLILKNPQTGDVLPSEPGLGLAEKVDGDWSIILPDSPFWRTALMDAPQDLISPQVKTIWLQMSQQTPADPSTGPLGGYRLPWAAGETVWLSQSTAHDAYITSGNAHFAYDFYIHDTMFDIHAAKSGTVWLYYDQVHNDDHSQPNYLVLRDDSTTPVTYQLYLHLAQDSIPTQLKAIGAPVVQGQFIGVADNTGQSTGHHLHFQIEEQPYWTYWGIAIDVTFDDVAINGGRPRVSWDLPYCTRPEDVCEDTSASYISGNTLSGDHIPPIGDILNPLTETMVTTRTLRLEGWGNDVDSGLASAQFIARYDGLWREVSEVFTSNLFSTTWDLCADQVPDGPIELALRLRDKSGNFNFNLPGLVHISKKFECPTPAPECVPGPDQAALFSRPNLSGACSLVDVGTYSGTAAYYALGDVGDNNLESIQAGENVYATLYMDSDLTGRGKTILGTDRNLSDDWIGANTTSSLIVQTKSSSPSIPIPIWPLTDIDSTSLSLVWEDRGASTQYQARLFEQGTQITATSWIDDPIWNLGSIRPVTHTWQMRSRNEAGQSAWSAPMLLKVISSDLPTGEMATAPYTDTMESPYANGWSHSNYWDKTDVTNATPDGHISWMYDTNSGPESYDTGEPNSGTLTSPTIVIPGTGAYYLRFKYMYDTEGSGNNWDQRWIQLSVDGGPFVNLLQLSDDQPGMWLNSPAIPLSAYAGQTIRVRFLFETLDERFNQHLGWFIDDFSIEESPPPECSGDKEPNDSIERAQAITVGESVSALICPGSDIDFYQFSGGKGDQIGVAIETRDPNSKLDSYLYLLDADGNSILAENDDQVLYQRTDSFLSMRLPYSGTFYLKVKAWDHPSAGGQDYDYSLKIIQDQLDPNAEFVSPSSGADLPLRPITLKVNATDDPEGIGISHVEFLWHSADWLSGDWATIDDDWDGSDSWSTTFDLSEISDQVDMAFYARIFDWAGNWTAAGVYGLDKITRYAYFPLVSNNRTNP